MAGLIISDQSDIPGLPDLNYIDTSNQIFEDILNQLISSDFDYLVIYAEAKAKDYYRSDTFGIELIKHIRLTPELKEKRNVAIILLYWNSFEYYLSKAPDSFICFSPGITLFRLPLAQNIKMEQIIKVHESTRSELKNFVISTENDIAHSEHQFRNDIAIEQMSAQINQEPLNILSKNIWYKKLYYRLYGNTIPEVISKRDFVNQKLRILLVDDNGNEWKPIFSSIFYNSEINISTTRKEALNLIEIQNKLSNELGKELFSLKKLWIANCEHYFAVITSREQNSSSIISNNLAITSVSKKLDELKEKFSKQNDSFNALIQRLQETGSIFDVLLSQEIHIDEKLKKDSRDLSESIQNVFNTRKELLDCQKMLDDLETKKAYMVAQSAGLSSQFEVLSKKRETIRQEIKNKIDKISQNSFDFIALDLRIDPNLDKGRAISEVSGISLLKEIKKLTSVPPVLIFSATSQSINFLYKDFSFIKGHFIKGLSPLKVLVDFTKLMLSHREAFYIQNIITFLNDYGNLYGIKYTNLDEAEYLSFQISQNDKNIILSCFSKIKKCYETITHLTQQPEKSQQIETVAIELGKIQEIRLRYPKSSYGVNSFWHHSNLTRNRVAKDEIILHEIRNDSAHQGNWKNQINDEKVRTLVDFTFKTLILT